jgi:hypothetical protein
MTANDDVNNHPEEWKSGSEPMTDAQRIYLDTLSDQTGEPTPGEHLTKSEATRKIEELREEAGYDTSTDDLDEP